MARETYSGWLAGRAEDALIAVSANKRGHASRGIFSVPPPTCFHMVTLEAVQPGGSMAYLDGPRGLQQLLHSQTRLPAPPPVLQAVKRLVLSPEWMRPAWEVREGIPLQQDHCCCQ